MHAEIEGGLPRRDAFLYSAMHASAVEAEHEFPWLPCELVTAVLEHSSLRQIASARLVCSTWEAASRADSVFHAALQRQWSLGPFESLSSREGALGRRFPSWRALFDALSRRRRLAHDLGPGSLLHLFACSESVRHFVFGLADGYMPAHDGCFTYHGEAATPIHYRHTVPPEGVDRECDDLDAAGAQTGLRFGGSWEWSCDRLAWHSTESTTVSLGLFAGSGAWALTDDNEELVRYLDDWPVMPLFRRACELTPEAVSAHILATAADRPADLLAEQHERFERLIVDRDLSGGQPSRGAAVSASASDAARDDHAFWSSRVRQRNARIASGFWEIMYSDSPTSPCVTSRALTVHQLLRPPIVLGVGAAGWAVPFPSTDAQASVVPLDAPLPSEAALNRRVMVDVAAPFGVIKRQLPMWAVVDEAFRSIRRRLGLDPPDDDQLPGGGYPQGGHVGWPWGGVVVVDSSSESSSAESSASSIATSVASDLDVAEAAAFDDILMSFM